MPVYFIQSKQISGQQIHITGELAHHLRNVLRFKQGETLDVVDENRKRYRITLNDLTPHQLKAHILAVSEPKGLPSVEILLAQALLKGPKMDWVIQKATELGISRFLPIKSERTVVRPSQNRASHQRERWSKIAREASQQSGRLDVPQVEDLIDFPQLCYRPLKVDLKLMPWEGAGGHPLRSLFPVDRKIRSVLLVIGPEGGFSKNEVDLAQKTGFTIISLGQRILRSETASLASLTILQYELGDME